MQSIPRPKRAATESPPAVPKWLPSTQLLDDRGEVWIQHRGTTYRLRETASGKLILTK